MCCSPCCVTCCLHHTHESRSLLCLNWPWFKQEAYIRGVSGWNFDVAALKRSANEEGSGLERLSTIAETPGHSQRCLPVMLLDSGCSCQVDTAKLMRLLGPTMTPPCGHLVWPLHSSLLAAVAWYICGSVSGIETENTPISIPLRVANKQCVFKA